MHWCLVGLQGGNLPSSHPNPLDFPMQRCSLSTLPVQTSSILHYITFIHCRLHLMQNVALLPTSGPSALSRTTLYLTVSISTRVLSIPAESSGLLNLVSRALRRAKMGNSQSIGTLFGGNTNALGLGNSITAEDVTKALNLEEYTAIVTGSSSGLGRECARVLAKRGAHVVLAARRVDVLEDVKADIIAETPKARVDVMPLNLSNLSSVRQFAEEYKQKNLPLNILMNNGGIFCKEFARSDEGIELMWATHVIGHYALTMLLMDKLKETAAESGIEGRIMFTGSEGHRITYQGGVDFDTLTNPSRFGAYKAYGQSKVGEILLARMIGQQLKKESVNVTANSAHPGSVTTPLGQNFFNKGITEIGYQASKPFIKSPAEGAATPMYVATSPDIKGVSGKYFSDRTEIKPSEAASSDELGAKVVKYCEDFMGAKLSA